jgi:hypothetical protein
MERILHHRCVPGLAGLDLVGLHCFLVGLQSRCSCFLRILFILLWLACLALLPVVSRTLCNLSLRVWIVDGFRVARTRGTTRWTQRFERRGLNVGDLGSQ